MGIDFTSFYIYRWRYVIGYSFITIVLVGLLVFAGLYVPAGISDQEMAAVVKSSSLSLTDLGSLAVTNLPFHLLQNASISLLGVNDFSIKLPSLILALISAIGLILLLRRWFRPNIAVLASIIAVTTGQFLFIAQSGTPGILYVLWAVWLLLIGTLIAKRAAPTLLWKILFFVIAALSLYTPLSIYALVALGTAALLHPHLRYIIGQLSKLRLIGAALLGLLIITPLIIGIIKSPELGLMILGIPSALPDFAANFLTLSQQYFGFMIPSNTNLMTPVFGLGSMLIIGFGMYRLIRTRESTQSYLILIWLFCLIPILLVNPRFTSVTFVPLVLLMATGLSSLLGYWYRLFPRNPYARIAGLVPLIVLISVLILSGLERYVYGYHYDPQTAPNFSQDLTLLPRDTKLIVVSDIELPFYTVVALHDQDLTVSTTASGDSYTATHLAHSTQPGYQLDHIVTSPASGNADRFYVYKKITQ
jgi:Dolichyl-phosphate-mannose-protein mannosyltransferase